MKIEKRNIEVTLPEDIWNEIDKYTKIEYHGLTVNDYISGIVMNMMTMVMLEIIGGKDLRNNFLDELFTVKKENVTLQ